MKDNYYKHYIEKLINVNPVTIEIERNEKVSDGYGGYIETPTVVNEVVVFYDRKARREIMNDYGNR